MKIISIDCGTKALGVCIVEIDTDLLRNLKDTNRMCELKKIVGKLCKNLGNNKNTVETLETIKKLNLRSLQKSFYNFCKVLYADVLDIIPNKNLKNVDDYERAAKLKYSINFLKKKCPDYNLVLIEYQMNINDKSRCVCNQILYAFADPVENTQDIDKAQARVKIVGASLKNTFSFNRQLDYATFLEKYTNNYDANKAHCRSNFIHFCQETKYTLTIPKQKIKDAADAFMMAYVYCLRYIE